MTPAAAPVAAPRLRARIGGAVAWGAVPCVALLAWPVASGAQSAPVLPVRAELPAPALLTIGAATGTVQVLGEAGRHVLEITASDSAPTVITYPIGDSLHVSIPAGAPGAPGPQVVIRVPLGQRVRAQSAGAGIRILGTRARVELRPVSGTIMVRDVLEVASDGSAGSLTADRVAAGVSIRSASGPVTLIGVGGDIEVITASGGVTIRDSRGASVRVRTTSGRVSWAGGMDAVGRYEFSSLSGPVALNIPRRVLVRGIIQHRRSRIELGADVSEVSRQPDPRGGERVTWSTAGPGGRVLPAVVEIRTTTGAVRIGRGPG